MSSKRAIRRKACKGKRRFETQDAAIRAAIALRRNRETYGHLSAYRCRWCGGFHFGHTPGQGQDV